MFKSINRYIINEYIKSLFIVTSVMLAVIFLIITNKRDINNNLQKIIIFAYGITIIIISEILLNFSSKNINWGLFLYVAPILFLIINWLLLNYFLNRENIKS